METIRDYEAMVYVLEHNRKSAGTGENISWKKISYEKLSKEMKSYTGRIKRMLGKDAKQVVGRALLISTTLRSFPSCSTTEPILNSSFNSSTDAIYSFVIMHFLLSDMFLFTSSI